jgi:TPR repeat protein
MLLLTLLACGGAETLEARCARCDDGDCATEDARACHDLGEAARRADPMDLPTAIRRYATACDRGDGEACAALGLLHQDGIGTPDDDAKALELYGRACDLGWGVGCFDAALLFDGGHGRVRDAAAATVWSERAKAAYEKQCAAGVGDWCTNLGFMYEMGVGVPQDEARAAALYDEGCAKGHADGCVNEGLARIYGRGVPQDAKTGAAALLGACESGSALGCSTYGQLFVKDGTPGIPKDPPKGVPYLEKGCAMGAAPGCAVLGAVYALGDGIPVDMEKANRYEARACDLGEASGCVALAYEQSVPAEAATWFQRACGMGDGDSCFGSARLRLESDPEGALRAFVAGCQLGSLDSCGALLTIGRPLPVPEADEPKVREALCGMGLPHACAPK